MSFELESSEPKTYQVHDRVYFEQEIRIIPRFGNLLTIEPAKVIAIAKYLLRKSLEMELPGALNSLLIDGAELSRIEVFPSCFTARIGGKHLVFGGSFSHKQTSAIKLMIQFIIPPDKIFNFVGAQLLDRSNENQSYFFLYLVKNKKDWPIEFVKLHLQIQTKKSPKKAELCEIDFESHQKQVLTSLDSSTIISYMDKFKPLESKTHVLEVQFQNGDVDHDTLVEVYVNESSLTKAETIVFVPGNMLESLEKFYYLLGTLESEIWWFEEHLDKDCFHFLE